MAPDLSLPFFQDVRLGIGARLALYDIVFLDAALLLDARQLLGAEPSRPLPFAIAVSYRFKDLALKTPGPDVTETRAMLSVAPLQDGIWGFGLGANALLGVRDRNPPRITLDTEGERYMSPNFDGVKDDIVLPLAITDERYVKGYRFIIADPSGAAVRTIQNKEDRPENRDFQNLMARLMYVKTGIAIPATLRWDGISDSGSVVPDGTYHYSVEAWDDNGNIGESGTGTVIVKNAPPSVTVVSSYLIFSPDGDGNKDTLSIEQSGSMEDEWIGEIRNIAAEEVASFGWKGSAPPNFEWDGTTNEGVTAPDGVYSYRITATDRAGNTGSAQLDNIIIDTQPKPVQLAIDLSYFSPNGDGIKDTVIFSLKVGVATGIEKWNLWISDAKGAVKRTYSGQIIVPASLPWDGMDDAGNVLPEGSYTASLDIHYVNGNNPKVQSPSMTIKLSLPRAAAKAEYDVFSPGGGGAKDRDTIFQDTSEELFWTGVIKDPAGKELKTLVWRGRADEKWVWDGRGDDGSLLPDGTYSYALASTDRAGNSGSSEPIAIRIDTEAKPVRVSTDLTYFSPNGDGVKDRVRIIPSVRVATGVDSWAFAIKNAKGETARSFTGRNRPPEEVGWDGIDDTGKHATDGEYIASLQVTYINGTTARAESNVFSIDTRYPQIDVRADAMLFSPSPDSRLPAVSIVQSSSEEDLWEGEMRDSAGQRIRGWYWKGKASAFSWDGKDDNGNVVADGYYTYAVKAQSKGGNVTMKELRGIQVDTRKTPVYVTASGNGFSPNGDGFRDDISFAIIASLREGVKSWKLTIMHPVAGEQKSFSGPAPVPQKISWDGKDKTGYATAAEGLYTAMLQVEYFKGNFSEAKTTQFRLAVSPPRVDIAFDGTPFSPDNDGTNDELGINLKVEDPVPIESWEIRILDPEEHPFNRFAGKGAPSERIIWNGTSENGEIVQSAEDYPLLFTVRDALGNSTTARKLIPVDILVIRDGDTLKVRIASITFAANTADYVSVEPDKAAKNSATIQRLAEIFRKYARYKIKIQGHANLVNWDNPARAKKEQEQELLPLSQQRADAIRDALVAQGIEAQRISTIGVGASEPIVPFSDMDNRWKNRRVEFILERE
jgi:flagellar hook assembly protein FlgD/outer membrane protein OmpA-like peptidoglycan-associated protein